MARHHSSSYSAKHPSDMTIEPEIATAVSGLISNGRISCPAAFSLAAEHSVSPSIIGAAIDLQEGRITHCQLGLFGYGPGPSPLNGDDEMDDDIEAVVTTALVDGRLSCERAWQIADERNLPRLSIAKACESLKVRIAQCQLGAF